MKNNFLPTKIACYTGYFVQAIINNLAPLFYLTFQKEFNIDYSRISWLIMLNFFTQLTVDFLSVRFISRVGYRVSVVWAHIFSAVGLVLLGILPRHMSSHYLGLIIPVIIYAMGSGLIEVLISPIIEGLPLKNKSGEMSLLHSFYCWGQMFVVLITTVAIKIAGGENWVYAPVLWAVIPFLNIFLFLRVPIFPPVPEGESEMKLRELFKSGTFIALAVLMVCSGASELAMAQWASAFAENSLGVSKLTGDILGPCFFAFLMAIARVLFGITGDRINVRKILTGSACLCILSYLIATLSPFPVLSLMGCGMCGFAVAAMWPGVFSLSAKLFPRGGTAMFAMLAMFGDIGCASGPWIAGLLSDSVRDIPSFPMEPLRFGLLLSVIFSLIMVIILNFTKLRKINIK